MRATGPTKATREAVLTRDSHCCIICHHAYGLQLHHRRPRGMGGTRRASTNRPSALITLCQACHAEVEARREWALDLGYLVPQHGDPLMVPVFYGFRRYYLTDDATFRTDAA